MTALSRIAPALAGLMLLSAACARPGAAPDDAAAAAASAPAAQAVAPSGPSAGDQEFARLTAGWSQAALDGCATQLRDALGTRDLVVGAADGVKDPEGKATSELADARRWIAEGDRMVDGVRPQLEAGACDGSVTVALDEAWQFYVKAGTSAVQAGQIAGT